MRDRVAPLSPRPPTLRFRGGASFGSPATGSVLRDLTETGALAAVALPAILSSIALVAVLARAPRSSGNSTATGRSPAVLSHGALGLGVAALLFLSLGSRPALGAAGACAVAGTLLCCSAHRRPRRRRRAVGGARARRRLARAQRRAARARRARRRRRPRRAGRVAAAATAANGGKGRRQVRGKGGVKGAADAGRAPPPAPPQPPPRARRRPKPRRAPTERSGRWVRPRAIALGVGVGGAQLLADECHRRHRRGGDGARPVRAAPRRMRRGARPAG